MRLVNLVNPWKSLKERGIFGLAGNPCELGRVRCNYCERSLKSPPQSVVIFESGVFPHQGDEVNRSMFWIFEVLMKKTPHSFGARRFCVSAELE